MIASKTNSEEAVELLLKNGANPDVVVKNRKIEDSDSDSNSDSNSGSENYTALIYAIEAENILIVCQLLELTNVELAAAFSKLADSSCDWKKDEDAFTKFKIDINHQEEN